MLFHHRVGVFCALAVIPLASYAAPAKQSGSPLVSRAKSILAARAIDPSSLQYRNVRIIHTPIQGKALDIACGEYNSKNRMGGYVGFQTFAYETSVLKGVMTFNGQEFKLITADGSDFDTPGAFGETNARIVAACLGMAQ